MTKEAVFIIMQKLNGQWLLRKQGVDLGTYKTRNEAEKAISRALHPEAYAYDEEGIQIDGC